MSQEHRKKSSEGYHNKKLNDEESIGKIRDGVVGRRGRMDRYLANHKAADVNVNESFTDVSQGSNSDPNLIATYLEL